jgi:hypothetical protein
MYICFFTLNFAVNRAIWYAVPENVKGMACLVVNDMLPCVAQGLGAFGALGLQRAGVAADSPLLTLSMIGGSFVWMAALHFKAKKGYQVHVVREFCNQVRARVDQDEILTGTLPALKMFVTAGTLSTPVRSDISTDSREVRKIQAGQTVHVFEQGEFGGHQRVRIGDNEWVSAINAKVRVLLEIVIQ